MGMEWMPREGGLKDHDSRLAVKVLSLKKFIGVIVNWSVKVPVIGAPLSSVP